MHEWVSCTWEWVESEMPFASEAAKNFCDSGNGSSICGSSSSEPKFKPSSLQNPPVATPAPEQHKLGKMREVSEVCVNIRVG